MAKKSTSGAGKGDDKPKAKKKTSSEAKAEKKPSSLKSLLGGFLKKKTPKKEAKPAPNDPEVTAQPVPINPEAYKFVLTPPAPIAPPVPAYEYLGELPDAYGTKKLFLVARDPYFLFAYWDLTPDQFNELVHQADGGNVFLHLHLEGGERLQQIAVPGWTKNWYLHANRPGATFYAELGIYRGGQFQAVARSGNASAPPDTVSWRTEARFATLPFHVSFRELVDLIGRHIRPGEELVDALTRLQEEGFAFPFDVHHVPRGQGNEAVYDYLGEALYRRYRVGSFDFTEILRRRWEENRTLSSGQWATSGAFTSPSSWGAPAQRDFFMHVNAELIFYGGTDPKARLRIDGRDVALREDGTFTYHFNLPDGRFHIPIEATSPDGQEMRSALLSFLRMSDYAGDVTATPQTPRPEPTGRAE